MRLEQLKRKKLDAIQDNTDAARKKGRSIAEEEVAGGDDNEGEDQESEDDDSEPYANLLDDLKKDCDDKKVNTFGTGGTVDYALPYKFDFDIQEFKFNTGFYDPEKSAKFRGDKKHESSAAQDKANCFVPTDSFPKNVRTMIDDLMSGPNAIMKLLLVWKCGMFVI